MNLKSITTGISTAMIAASVYAQDTVETIERVGKPVNGGIGLQPASTAVAEQTYFLNDLLLWVSAILSVFVMVLLLLLFVFYRDKGKEPKRFSHNTPLEIVWTLVPVLVLVAIGVFSVPALKAQTEHPEGDVVINVTGLQWSWDYEYPQEEISFSSVMLQKEQLAEYGYKADEYLLAVDNALVVPVGKDVVVNVTSDNVIHSWKIPAFAVQVDAVPGRTMVTSFNATKEGVYFGQCSELCGKDHAYMPITLFVVSEEQYAAWLSRAKEDDNFFYAPQPEAFKVASN